MQKLLSSHSFICMRHICFILLLICCLAKVNISYSARVSTVDSICAKCYTYKNDTSTMKCLGLLAFELSYSNPRLGLIIAKRTLGLATRASWDKGVALANNEIALNYFTLSNTDSAYWHYLAALSSFRKLKDKNSESGVMANMSLLYKVKGDYKSALYYANQALLLNQQCRNNKSTAIILENIGSLFLEQNDLEKAKSYYTRAGKLYQKEGNNIGLARNLMNLGIIYDKEGAYRTAINSFKSSLLAGEEANRKSSMQVLLANLGIAYMHLQDYDSALYYQRGALKLSEGIANRHAMAIDYGNIGETYLEMYRNDHVADRIKQAIFYLREGYELCRQLKYTPPQIEFGAKLVEAIEYEGEDFKSAFVISKHVQQLKDSVFSKDNSIRLAKMEAQREILMKENELVKIKSENKISVLKNGKSKNEKTILVLGILVFFLIAIIMYMLYMHRANAHKRKMTEMKQFQSHEVRTPVVKITSIVNELMESKIAGTDEEYKLLGMLKDSIAELDYRIHEFVAKLNKK